MSRPAYCLTFYVEKEIFKIDKFLGFLDKTPAVQKRYSISYKDLKLKSEETEEILKFTDAFRDKKVSSLYVKISLRQPNKLPGFELHISVSDYFENEYVIYMSLTPITIEDCFLNPEYSEESTWWLFNFFKGVSVNSGCIYSYVDFDETGINRNKKIVAQNDGTYKVVLYTIGKVRNMNKPHFPYEDGILQDTSSIFNELSYFSEKLLNQNNNRKFVLSKDFAKVIHLENGGIIVIDHKNILKKTLLKLLEGKNDN